MIHVRPFLIFVDIKFNPSLPKSIATIRNTRSDDAFDIDDAGDGDIKVELENVQANDNMDEGLDSDEVGNGDSVKLNDIGID